jgi:hypothetical protein
MGLAIACGLLAVPPAAERAGAAASCAGVTVVVDFTHFNGNIERGCAPNPSSGLDALHQAGFTTAGTTQYGDAFVCRIANLPAPAQESCASTPPATAYWAYSRAQANDSSWTYSPIAASSTHPAAGTVEGYAFGARAVPGVAPKDVALPRPSPTTTPARPTLTTTAANPASTTPPAVNPRGAGGSAIAPTGGNSTTPTTRRSAQAHKQSPDDPTAKSTKRNTRATTTTVAPRKPAIVDRSGVASAPTSEPSSGSPIGVIVTVVLLAFGATGAFLFVRGRRRRVLEP